MNAPVPIRDLAQGLLNQWAIEVNAGGGLPNILERWGQGSGSPVYPPHPGPIFSPRAEKADWILRDMMAMDPPLAQLMMAVALDVPQHKIAEFKKSNRLQVRADIEEAWGAFEMGVHFRMQVLRQWDSNSAKRARRMVKGDIGI